MCELAEIKEVVGMSKIQFIMFVAFVGLMSLSVSCLAWATGEVPPPQTPCVDVVQTCQDAASPTDPIVFELTVTNCGDAVLYCNGKDLLTDEPIVFGEAVGVGQSVTITQPYYAACGESTKNPLVKCSYALPEGGTGDIFGESEATCRIPCDGDTGCTLTPGYWKTHSIFGPAPYDATWALVGENTPFFLSGVSFYEALWTVPSGGNAYFILAHAYIAAHLNVLSGASMPSAVETAFNNATNLLSLYTPAYIGGLKGKSTIRKNFLAYATILDDYNNGLSGPGHCDDSGDGDGGTCQ